MKCRHCDLKLRLSLVDLVSAPPSNAYLTQQTLQAPEKWFPLRVFVQRGDTGKHPVISSDVNKSCDDLIAQAYGHTYKLPVAITCCGNFHGSGDLNWNRIIPGIIRSILQGKAPAIQSDGSYFT
jgi:nucleoside-diphosphate-sugar epimerase